jgi:hypothetical protein
METNNFNLWCNIIICPICKGSVFKYHDSTFKNIVIKCCPDPYFLYQEINNINNSKSIKLMKNLPLDDMELKTSTEIAEWLIEKDLFGCIFTY